MQTGTNPFRFHPEGVATLVAVIVADLDVPKGNYEGLLQQYEDALRKAIDHRREQVLELADSYYKINDCDFNNDNDWKESYARNGLNNLAKLDRKNLRS